MAKVKRAQCSGRLSVDRLPVWAMRGQYRFARICGGPLDALKGYLSGWGGFINHPDNLWAAVLFFRKRTVELLKAANINWIWATWSAGFSLKSEAVQRESVAKFIRECRKVGIHVSAYMSLVNMFRDSILKDEPETDAWKQIGPTGRPNPYASAYYPGEPTRILACVNRPGWLRRAKRIVKSAIDSGADGITMDNMFQNCYCPTCLKGFKAYCLRKYGRVYVPPRPKKQVELKEEVVKQRIINRNELAFRQFQTESVRRFLEKLRIYAASLKPDIVFSCNSHMEYQFIAPTNAILVEDGREPGVKRGELITNTGLCKYLWRASEGWKPILIEPGKRHYGSISPVSQGRDDGPMSNRHMALEILEKAAYHGSTQVYLQGVTRSEVFYEKPDMMKNWKVVREYFDFLDKHVDLYAKSSSYSNIAFMTDRYQKEAFEALTREGIYYDIVLTGNFKRGELKKYEAVIVGDLQHVDDDVLKEILEYNRKGLLIACGDGLQYNGRLRIWRSIRNWLDSLGNRYVPLSADAWGNRQEWEKTAGTIARILRKKVESIVEIDSLYVKGNLCRSNSARILYLLNYGDKPASNIRVRLKLSDFSVGTLQVIYAPKGRARSVKCIGVNGESVEFMVPRIDVGAVVKIVS